MKPKKKSAQRSAPPLQIIVGKPPWRSSHFELYSSTAVLSKALRASYMATARESGWRHVQIVNINPEYVDG